MYQEILKTNNKVNCKAVSKDSNYFYVGTEKLVIQHVLLWDQLVKLYRGNLIKDLLSESE